MMTFRRVFTVALLFSANAAFAGVETYPGIFSVSSRSRALNGHPFNSFAFEMQKLGERAPVFPAIERSPGGADVNDPKSGLPQGSADLADMPADVRAYEAGARGWRLALRDCPGNTTDHNDDAITLPRCTALDVAALDESAAQFEQVLAMPRDQARYRGIGAAYMLGKVEAYRAALAFGTARFEFHRDASMAAFRDVRLRAAEAPDTQGLASASLGEEARLHLYTVRGACDWLMLRRRDTCVAELDPDRVVLAMKLYVSQIAGGSANGLKSLSTLARAVLAVPSLTEALARDPFAQSVLTPYVIGVVSGNTERNEIDPRIANYLVAIDKVDVADRAALAPLASLYLRQGLYDEAGRMADRASGPMAHWVRAKLALRSGEHKHALDEFTLALGTSATNGGPSDSLHATNRERIAGERALLKLSRGDYLEAMDQLHELAKQPRPFDDTPFFQFADESGNWDTAGVVQSHDVVTYLAERVLTLDELAEFMLRVAPAAAQRELAEVNGYTAIGLDDQLRWLLARRFFRAGRFAEGLPFFPVRVKQGSEAVYPRTLARRYADSLAAVAAAVTPVAKAALIFDVARLEREWGMELLGFHGAPDFFQYAGLFSDPDLPWGTSHSGAPHLVSGVERERFDQTVASPNQRFHYRYLAADHAVAAADLLPERSQASVAALCFATRWMKDGPHAEAETGRFSEEEAESLRRIRLYQDRFAKQGHPTDSQVHRFGSHCDEPDFAAALVENG